MLIVPFHDSSEGKSEVLSILLVWRTQTIPLAPIRVLIGCGRRVLDPTNKTRTCEIIFGVMNKIHRRTLLASTGVAGLTFLSGRAAAQDPSDEDIKLFRKDIRSVRKQIIAANMDLSDTEAEQFWPLFDRYTAELVTITDRKYALLKEYAQTYTTMTGEEAEKYIRGRAAVDESIMQMRLKYLPLFRRVLPGRSTALFFQIDWRLGLIMDLQLASQTPLIEP
jgi:hypothetical protein